MGMWKILYNKGDYFSLHLATLPDPNPTHQGCCLGLGLETRDSTGTHTGTVPGRNNIASVHSLNIFCFGAGPCKAFSLDI